MKLLILLSLITFSTLTQAANLFTFKFQFEDKKIEIPVDREMQECMHPLAYNEIMVKMGDQEIHAVICPVKGADEQYVGYLRFREKATFTISLGNEFTQRQEDRITWQERGFSLVKYQNPDQNGHCQSRNGDIYLGERFLDTTIPDTGDYSIIAFCDEAL